MKVSSLETMLQRFGKVCDILSHVSGPDENALCTDILGSTPTFILCGPRGSGKSSIVRRVTGLVFKYPLTYYSGRLPMVVEIRRKQAQTCPCHYQVSLYQDDRQLVVTECKDQDSFAECLKTVREKAASELEPAALAQGAQEKSCAGFAIRVRVEGADLTNITLVDTPGFDASSGFDAAVFQSVLKCWCGEEKKPHVLEVVRGDQAYVSMLPSDMNIPVTTVLTHCDQVSATKEAKAKLDDAVKKASALGRVFAIVGNLSSELEEQSLLEEAQLLAGLKTLDRRIAIGADGLVEYLHGRIEEHLQGQYPKAQEKLLELLEENAREANKLKKRAPMDVIFDLKRSIELKHKELRNERENWLREKLRDLVDEVKSMSVIPRTKLEDFPKMDNFDPKLEVGMTIATTALATVTAETKTFQVVKITEMNKHKKPKVVAQLCSEPGEIREWSEERDVHARNIAYVSFERFKVDMADCTNKRGLRNKIFADPQPVLQRYCHFLAEQASEVVIKYLEEAFAHFEEHFNQVFAETSALAQPVAEYLKRALGAKLRDVQKDARAQVARIQRYYTSVDLTYAANEASESDRIEKIMAECGVDEEWECYRQYTSLRVFLQMQRETLIEVIGKEFVLCTLLASEEALLDVLSKPCEPYAHLVRESSSQVYHRTVTLKRKEVLDEAVKTLKKV